MEKRKVVIVGAGLGGMLAAFEIHKVLGDRAEITVVSDSDRYSFVPSNPWVAVRWRKPEAIQIDLPPLFAKHGIRFTSVGAKRVVPDARHVELRDGSSLAYDYLVLTTGPHLAFDEVPGLGPHGGHTVSVCHTDHATLAAEAFDRFVEKPGPIVVGAAQGASCYGPAYEFALILDTELRRRRIRDQVPMTFVTAEPYIGHLGLDGVGDTKGLLESALRERHIKWVTNARITSVEPAVMHVEEVGDGGVVLKQHDLPFAYSMILPAFRGIPAVAGIEGLTNPRGFILIDRHQRNPRYPEIYAAGVCVAIPPVGPTPVPVGVPKTGFMIESMVMAIAANLASAIDGREPAATATWNAVCLADFGDSGVAFIAQPQIPPRNLNWSGSGKWVHVAKVAFEKYFLYKLRRGESEPFYEKLLLDVLGIGKLK